MRIFILLFWCFVLVNKADKHFEVTDMVYKCNQSEAVIAFSAVNEKQKSFN